MGLYIWGSRAKYNKIEDAGAYYTSDTVEGALQEIGTAMGTFMTELIDDTTPVLGGDLDINHHCIMIVLNHAIAKGKCIYLNGTTPTIAEADSSTTMPAIGISMGPNQICIGGWFDIGSNIFTPGDVYYVGLDGSLTNDISGFSTGDQVQRIGVAVGGQDLIVEIDAGFEIKNEIISGRLSGSHEGIGYFILDDTSTDYVLFKATIPDGSVDYEVRFIVAWDVSPASAGAIDWGFESSPAAGDISPKPAVDGTSELTIADAAAGKVVIITKEIANTAVATGDLITVLLDVNVEDIGGENLKVFGAYLIGV